MPCFRGLPISRAMRRAYSSLRSRRITAAFFIGLARSMKGTLRHAFHASCASHTAAAVSCGVISSYVSSVSPVAGLIDSIAIDFLYYCLLATTLPFKEDLMHLKGLGTLAVAFICMFFMPSTGYAQVATGTILGNVTDSTGGAVPGATVTATNVDTQFSRETVTDESGQYALRLLPLGNYKVDVTLTGFKTFSQTGILLEAGRNARIDAIIEPGNVAESVSVVADA